jgi:hypothetical protein
MPGYPAHGLKDQRIPDGLEGIVFNVIPYHPFPFFHPFTECRMLTGSSRLNLGETTGQANGDKQGYQYYSRVHVGVVNRLSIRYI